MRRASTDKEGQAQHEFSFKCSEVLGVVPGVWWPQLHARIAIHPRASTAAAQSKRAAQEEQQPPYFYLHCFATQLDAQNPDFGRHRLGSCWVFIRLPRLVLNFARHAASIAF